MTTWPARLACSWLTNLGVDGTTLGLERTPTYTFAHHPFPSACGGHGHLASQAAPIKPLRFSTGATRAPAWTLRALNERKIVLPLEPVAGSEVRADIEQWPYHRLGVLSATLCGLRHGTNIGPAHADNDDQLYFGITLAGRSIARQRRGEVTLRDGDGVLLSAP